MKSKQTIISELLTEIHQTGQDYDMGDIIEPAMDTYAKQVLEWASKNAVSNGGGLWLYNDNYLTYSELYEEYKKEAGNG